MPYALITGASKGIGKAIATELASRKKDILLIARSESLLQQLSQELVDQYKIDCHYLAIDLSADDAPSRLMNWLEEKNYAVDTLINNAGYGLSGKFEGYTPADYHDMMQVNMQVPVTLSRMFIPELNKHPKAYILNIVSSAAYQSVPGLTVYAATKSFLLSFSRGLKHELRKTNISVTAVSPGGTDTEFASRANVGDKAVNAGKKLNMTPQAVARIAINSMYAGKAEVITGLVNKLGAFLVWLLPKKLAEKTAANLYGID